MLIDLLKERIPVALTTGLVLLDAHRITEFGLEAFIIDLYRAANRLGFIKAFTDQATAITGGFGKVERLLKFLRCPRLLLYPRFQATVRSELDGVPIEVGQVQVGMTQRMKIIQLGLLEIMETCLHELLRANPSLDTREFTSETVITTAFEQQIRRQLDPIWHRVSLKSKQLLSELRILRTLLHYLVQYDPISYCRFVETVVMADIGGGGSMAGGGRANWLMLDTAQGVIRTAKERVYSVSPADGSLKAKVERMNKWRALESILAEEACRDRRIIIMVAGRGAQRQLMRIMAQGYEAWEQHKFSHYLAWRARARLHGGLARGVAVGSDPGESILPTPAQRKGRLVGRSPIERVDLLSDPLDALQAVKEGEEQQQMEAEEMDEAVLSELQAMLPTGTSIHAYEECAEDPMGLLERTSPDIVIMYDGDLAFIRTLEVYARIHVQTGTLAVHMLVYKESVEEQLQLLGIRQEKEAFEHLIRIKAVPAGEGPVSLSFTRVRSLEHGPARSRTGPRGDARCRRHHRKYCHDESL